MPSARTLLRLAEQADRDADALEAEAAKAREQARQLRAMAESAGTNEVLHKRLRPSSVNEPMMPKNHRLRISEGHKSEDEPFRNAIRAKGFSQNSLAKRVGLNQAVLSLHRKCLRQIKRSKAEAIAKLTGWPADAKHWPCGIADE